MRSLVSGLLLAGAVTCHLPCAFADETAGAAPVYQKTEKAPLTRQGVTVMENDADAQGGKALRMAPEKKQSNAASDFYFYPTYPGKYRFIWRMKIDDNAGEARVVDIWPLFPAWGANKNPTLSIKPSAWKAPNAYQDFTVEGLVPEHDYGVFMTYFDATINRSVWWDTSTFQLVERFDDERIAREFYPAFKMPEQIIRTAGEGKPRAYVMYYSTTYATSGLRGALASLGLTPPAEQALPADMRGYQPPPERAAGEWREVAYIDHGQSRLPAPGFPSKPEEFANLDLIVLSDASPRALQAPSRLMLRQWVQDGGGLLLTGGMHAFGKGFLDGTALEEMLPVELKGPNDLQMAKDGKLVWKDDALKALVGDTIIATKFLQGLKPKAGVRVLAETGDGNPLLVQGKFGKGTVTVWLGAALGSTPEGQTAWWKAEQWPRILGEVLKRTAAQ